MEVDKKYFELVEAFPLFPLRSKRDLRNAVKVMKKLAYRTHELSRGESDYLYVLGDLIHKYEQKLPRFAEELEPRELLKFLMESNSLAQVDLVAFVGHKSNLSAFLNGKRGLSKKSACNLGERFKVSPSVFLRP